MNRRTERGATAIIYAIVAVVLVGVAALAVDLGNGLSRKSDVQGQADFAALTAAPLLGTQKTGTPSTAVLDAVRAQLNENRVLNADGTCVTQAPCVADNTQLTDGNTDNGEARFCTGLNAPAAGCRKAGFQVVAPQARVDFGFAGIFGIDGADVQGSATVALKSPASTLPLYAVSGCDYGRQTLTDPANGQGSPLVIPPLQFPADDNGSDLQGLSPVQVPRDATGVRLTVTVTGLDHVTKVGFFQAGLLGPWEQVVIVQDVDNPTVPVVAANNVTATVTVTIPAAVTAVEDVWWVRVYSGPAASNAHQDEWSPATDALPLRVGASVLECGSGSTDGNFGSLGLERTDVTNVNDELAMNIIDLQPPTSLIANTDPGITILNATCSEGLASPDGTVAVVTDLPNPGQSPNTNCARTDTGLPANAATDGFITGVSGTPGRLREPTTCGPGGSTSSTTVTLQSSTYAINNDVLSCFLTGGHNLQEISSPSYCSSGPSCPAFDASIYESPRFFYVPVLKTAPLTGLSTYWIVDFRPAFLTDEVVASTSTKANGGGATSENGVHIEQNQIKSVKVIFFNVKSLPGESNGPVQDYLGVGAPIIRLID